MGVCDVGRSPLWKAAVDSRGRDGIQFHGGLQGLKGRPDPSDPCVNRLCLTPSQLTTELSKVVKNQRERSALHNRAALRSDVLVDAPVGCRARRLTIVRPKQLFGATRSSEAKQIPPRLRTRGFRDVGDPIDGVESESRPSCHFFSPGYDLTRFLLVLESAYAGCRVPAAAGMANCRR
jgi:hypothetical protein